MSSLPSCKGDSGKGCRGAAGEPCWVTASRLEENKSDLDWVTDGKTCVECGHHIKKHYDPVSAGSTQDVKMFDQLTSRLSKLCLEYLNYDHAIKEEEFATHLQPIRDSLFSLVSHKDVLAILRKKKIPQKDFFYTPCVTSSSMSDSTNVGSPADKEEEAKTYDVVTTGYMGMEPYETALDPGADDNNSAAVKTKGTSTIKAEDLSSLNLTGYIDETSFHHAGDPPTFLRLLYEAVSYTIAYSVLFATTTSFSGQTVRYSEGLLQAHASYYLACLAKAANVALMDARGGVKLRVRFLSQIEVSGYTDLVACHEKDTRVLYEIKPRIHRDHLPQVICQSMAVAIPKNWKRSFIIRASMEVTKDTILPIGMVCNHFQVKRVQPRPPNGYLTEAKFIADRALFRLFSGQDAEPSETQMMCDVSRIQWQTLATAADKHAAKTQLKWSVPQAPPTHQHNYATRSKLGTTETLE